MLEFEVKNQTIKRIDRFNPATDSVDYLTAKFNFLTADWDGRAKTAIFKKGTDSYSVPLKDDSCTVPYEVLVVSEKSQSQLVGNNKIFVSVFGLQGASRLPTNEIRIDLNTSGYAEGETPKEPTPDAYAQYVEQVEQLVNSVNTPDQDYNAESEAGQSGKAVAQGIEHHNTDTEAHADIRKVLTERANALKGNASGEIVRVNDVSPAHHNVKVKITGADDPSSVTVTRYGKNVLCMPEKTGTITNADGMNLNGSLVGGQITLKGTFNGGEPKAKVIYTDLQLRNVNYSTHASIVEALAVKLPIGTYIFTANESISSNVASVSGGSLIVGEIGGSVAKGTAQEYKNGDILTVENDNCYAMFVVYIYADTVSEDFSYTGKPQLEAGSISTEWEQGVAFETYTPDTDGNCEITSLAPTMTLLTDTAGVTIDLEYNKDINAENEAVRADITELDRITGEHTNLIGDFETALDELHAYAQALIGGEA